MFGLPWIHDIYMFENLLHMGSALIHKPRVFQLLVRYLPETSSMK